MFRDQGAHHIEILLDGELKLHYPMRVVIVPQQQPPPAIG
jgi:hypothetical protein